ncbi:N-acetylmuramoyl-L-alanine amidase [Streptococcus infantarius subsp. infantarius]|nr:N-acetylmuramoyl-L-alanine amidase [Streptococcus infantarius subsp. infantarius]MCO4656095.1 N-acetylmuramoyl-L-alanine amidase [Streptococcus infantarius subsp. infantarius]MCO4656900.1 N-acetylmuramoyl-L-alanine amidase [Streptococcus infantarius subsp. infantarius]MCO4667657.1 N-acetylmuramoyl-L-alanine amidase [Streptococcus infantarius subsp. infantarius]MCO4670664.1 N-acetylmuramoyl-L-alanine amidase [Streptococcus infantarius subsp. infantarius]
MLSGVLLTAIGAGGVCADEVQASTSATVNSVLADVNSENYQADAGLSEETSDLSENDKANELNSESASSSINDEQSTTTTEQTEVNDDKEVAVTDDSNSTGAESEQVDNFSENQTESIVDANANSQLTDESQNVKPEITANDSQKLVAERRATGNATDEVTSATLTNKGFDIQYNQTIPAGAKIMFAVWSEVNGQDGLIWYTADSNGHVVAKYTGSYGKYNIHTYQNINGQMIGLNSRTIDVPKPSAKVTITKVDGTTYKVTASDIPAYITSIQLPTWTEKGGQNDIQLYSTTKNADGTFTRIFSIAEHNLEGGKYNVHVYGTNAVTNSLTCLTGTSIEADYHFSDVHVQPTLTTNGFQISMPSDVSSDMTVYHVVWSANNDQDDLIWYKVPTNGQLTA